MTKDYKICKRCGAKVGFNANFCPDCKSQSFKTDAVVVRKSNEPVSLKHKLFYWNYNGEFVLSKSKIAAISTFILFSTVVISPVSILFALIVAFLIFIIGFSLHQIRGRPSEPVVIYNDYGLLKDIYHLFFFWQNKKTGEFVLSKTKIISFILFLLIAAFTFVSASALTLSVAIMVGLIFETPAFIIGWGIHKLTNPNPSNPKKIPPKKEPEKITKKEEIKTKVEKTVKKEPPKPEVIPKFVEYENQIEDLKDEFNSKQKVARDMIEKRFAPPQLTYTRFISVVDKAGEIFAKESDSALNILHLATEESPRIDSEVEGKIGVLNSIIDRIDDLTNELIISMDSSDDGDVDNLIDDMENLVSSVKDYKD